MSDGELRTRFTLKRRWLGALAVGAGLLTCASAFQNCANIKPSAKSVRDQASIEAREAGDKIVFDKYLGEASLKVWVSAQESVVTAPATLITHVFGLKDYTLRLAPDGPSPRLGVPPSFQFEAAQNLKSDGVDLKMRADKYSFIAIFDRAATGRLLSVQVGNSDQDFSIVSDGAKFKISRSSAPGHSTSVEGPINSSSLQVVAGSFGLDATENFAQVNGAPITSSATIVGAPVASTYSLRRLVLGDPSGTTNFRVREVMVFTEFLDQRELNAFSRLLGEKWGVTDLEYVP